MKEFYEFASFRLDIKKHRLMRGDEVISLTPKEFGVLLLLIENAGRVVEKDELLDAVWKDTFVEEATLTRNISWLRKKLSANDENAAKFIETVPKLGYKFLPEIKFSENAGIYVEEQIVQEIHVEETIEIIPSSANNEVSIVDGEIREISKQKFLPGTQKRKVISQYWIIPVILIFAVAGFLTYQAFINKNQSNVILATKIVPFSGLPGREISPSFSPDGKSIVYAWDNGNENASLDIYIKLVGAGEPVRLTETAEDEINPVYSPDGKSIAFVRNFPDHNEIILIPALGGAERKIYEQASYVSISFSPDGKFLAAANLDLSKNDAGIFFINLANGEKTQITKPENPGVDLSPRFSPDGENLAFIRYFGSFRREIFVVSAKGGEPRQITFDDTRIYSLDWSKDNQHLFFTSFRSVGQLNLWQISVDEKDAPRMIPTGSKNPDGLSVSPDSKMIAFVEETADENIWEIDAESKSHPIIRSTRADHSPQFSPDSSQIVFASERTGNYEIWIADADGKNQKQITDSQNSAGSPRFSPDGKFVLYDAQYAEGSDIYIISVNGGAPRRLTENAGNNSLPAWSADGNSIFFLSNRSGSAQIWKMPVNGGPATQITKNGAFEMFAAPDNKTIIYSKSIGKMGLWSVTTKGEDEQPIHDLSEVGGWRSWSVTPDGIYFTSFLPQIPLDIKFYDFTTKQTKKIVSVNKPPLTYYSNLSVSNDGKRILYARQDQTTAEIMLAKISEE